MKSINDINIGDKEQITHIVTQDDIDKFVNLTGDDNKLHVDEVFAQKTSFKKPVVHGMLGASFISTVIGTKLPGDGALWYKQSLEFLLPARIDDIITISAEVKNKWIKEGIIELETIVINQNKQVLIRGTAKVKLLELIYNDSEDTEHLERCKKNTVIFGASGGLGIDISKKLLGDDHNLSLQYFNSYNKIQQNVIDKFDHKKIITFQANILNRMEVKDGIEKTIRKFGSINSIVISVTAPITNTTIEDLEWSEIEKHFNYQIKGTYHVIKEALPYLVKHKNSKIVLIGSMVIDKPVKYWASYNIAKSALSGFMKTLAVELGPKGIQVNMVSPSFLDNDLNINVSDKEKLIIKMNTPIRRILQSSEVANAVSYLLSDSNSYIHGEIVRLYGGQYMT